MDDTRVLALRTLVEPILAQQGVELVELTCRPQGRQTLVRLLVDRVGGITLQQCAHVNQLVGQALDTANLITESYTVEVSSPGADRPLANQRDFERAIGEAVIVQQAAEDGRIRERQGTVLAVTENGVVLKTVAGNLPLPFAQIRHAKKALRW